MPRTTSYRRGIAAAVAGLSCLAATALPAHAASVDLVINEVYSRGGNAGQPLQTKFVELFNKSAAPISLSGYTLAYSSAGTAGLGASCALTGTVAANGYFVIAVGSNGSAGVAVAAQQSCGGMSPSGSAGAFTLLNGGATVDLVGWGNALRSETSAAVYSGSNATPGSISRLPNGTDTDDNATHLAFTSTPTPGARNAGDTPPEPEAAPTRTIAEIQGVGPVSPLAGTKVSTTGVVTAVYPAGGFNGVYLQTPGTGGVAKGATDASDGIFLYSSWASKNLQPGDCVTVTDSTAKEYSGLTELDGGFVAEVAGCAAVTPTPLSGVPATDAAKEAYEGMLVLPQGDYTIANNYGLNQYGQLGLVGGDEPLYVATDVVAPGPDALAYEAANQARLITLDDGSSWNYQTNATAKASPLPYLSADEPMRTSSQLAFTAPVILDYRFQWNYQPTGQIVGATDPDDPVASTNDREASPPRVGGGAQLAAFNVLNYFTDLGMAEEGCAYYADRVGTPVTTNMCEVRGAYTESAFADQRAKIVTAINGMDAEAVALMEIENSAGISYIDHARDYTLASLVKDLNGPPAGRAGRTPPRPPWSPVPRT